MIKPLTGILVCGLIVSMIFNGVFLLRNSELDKAYGGLNNMYDELKGAYDGLNTTYSEMDKAYDELNATYFSLMPRAMGFQSISMGDGNGGFYGRLVIRNLSKWDEVWNAVQLRCSSYVPNSTGCHSVPPYVDFSKNVVVAVSTFGATSGYGVEVEEIWDVGQYVLVEVKRTYPSQGCITLQMTTNPYHFVMMPRTSKPIMFNTTEVPLICGD